MRVLSHLVPFAIAICGLLSIEVPAAASSFDVTGTWEVTIHYPPPEGDYEATYVLEQDGEKVTGEYQGLYGPAAVTGSIKSDEVVLRVTVRGTNAEFTGKLTSATTMSGMVTGTSDQPRKWSAEKKK